MQAEQVQVLVQQAAAGNVDAFVTLIQTYGHGLRLALAAHLEQSGAIAPVEIAVWSAVRQRLGEWLSDTPFPTWVQQIAVEQVKTHLDQADRRAIDIQDALTHQIIEHCRQALADGGELGVTGLGPLVQALPEASRQLLGRRYRERQRTSAIATSLMIGEAEVATSLMAARAACDWRQIARPPAPGDRLLPPLIEDWLSGTIDVDSRSLLATNLGRDLDKATQFARQVRVHLALGALLVPFTRDDASALARQSGMGALDSGRVMMGATARPVSGPRPAGSEAHRPVRMPTSNRQVVPILEGEQRSSPMPLIIGGVMVLVGVLALLASSLGGGSARTVASVPSASTPPVVTPPAQSAPTVTGPVAGGALRPLQVAPSEPRVKVILSSDTYFYSSQPLELRALVNGIPNATEVEYWNGDLRIGSAREIPYSVTWIPARTGTLHVTARVLIGSTVKTTSEVVSIAVVTSHGTGQITRERWEGLGGDFIAPTLATLSSTTPPNLRATESRFESPRNNNDSYLQRMSGYVIPPQDGEYVFWICTDDQGELWLSTDETRDNRKLIASVRSPVSYEDWETLPEQRSQPIRLRAGQRYYCEALHKEGGGDDHLRVGWKLPDGRMERPILGAHLSPAPAMPTPTGPAVAANPAPSPRQPPVEIASTVAAGNVVQVLWDGEATAGGSGYASSGITKSPGSGRGGGTGLQANLSNDFVNLGWNWRGWFPDDGGDDVRAGNALSFWLRLDGSNRPTEVTMQFLCGPKNIQARSAPINVLTLVPTVADGAWHQVVIPFEQLAAPDFNLGKLWEFNLRLRGNGPLNGNVMIDDITVLRVSTTVAAPVAVPAAAKTPSAPVTPAPAGPTVKIVRAINLGGEAVELDGVRFSGHRQAEAEGATLAGSHQPGPWLSDLNWVRGTTGVNEIRRDRNMENRPMKIDGKLYAKGLGVHANSELVFALDGKQSGFTAVVGVDDEGNTGEVIFQVYVDGHKAWDSGVMRKGPGKSVAVPLVGRKELRLVVDANGPNDWDWSNWANAQFLRPGGDDGVLMVKTGRRTTSTFNPKPAVDAKLRSLLTTALVGSKEGLAFSVRAPNGPSSVYVWVAENGSANSRQFDLTVEGVTVMGIGQLPANGWEKIGPIAVNVTDGTIDVAATVIKGIPQLMGIAVEQAPEAVAATVTDKPVVDDFERDAPEWSYVAGGEFPGAKGSSARDIGTARSGSGAYRLDYDFTGGGVYVGTWKKFETVKVPDITELRFWVKAANLPAFGIRLADGSDQIHQSSIRLLPTTEWQEVVVRINQAVGGEHWGGANDGQWHPPLKGLGINVGKDTNAPSGTMWIDDLSFVVAPAKP